MVRTAKSIRDHVEALAEREPVFARVVEKHGVPEPRNSVRGAQTLLRTIVGQQVSVAAARTILGRIAAAHGFAPERLADATIDGMPRRRAETIRLLARAVVTEGGLPAGLTSIPGIGPWTEQYIAMRLGDPDAFPSGDLILRRNAGNLTESALLRRAEAWRPFRAYGAMLLWTTAG